MSSRNVLLRAVLGVHGTAITYSVFLKHWLLSNSTDTGS